MSRLAPDWLSTWATADPERLAVTSASFRWTNQQLDSASDALALALREAGTGEGDRVAALLADDAPAVALLASARRLAAVLVPLHRGATDSELEHHLAVASVRIIVHDVAHAQRARALAAGRALVAGRALAAGRALRALAVEPILEQPVAERPSDALRGDVDLDAAATIVFTSGTTGIPRGAVLSHGNHAASADAWAAVLRPRREDRWLACLPLFHVAGLAVVQRAGRWGVPLEVAPRFHPRAVSEAIEAGISHLSLVPRQLERLLTERGSRPVPPTLRAVLLGGGPIPLGLLARARAAALPVLVTYGMTETSSGIAVGRAAPESGSHPPALRPLPGVGLRITSPDADGIGEIMVRGPMVFQGYVADEDSTAERLHDGWLRTGDLGHLDERALLHVADRRDDLIIRGGENVYPAEVEAVLVGHPDVAEAAVVGRPDPAWGSIPVAAIVLVADATVSDAALERYVRDRVASYKVPAGFHRVATLPRNAAGKVMRRELRDALLEGRP